MVRVKREEFDEEYPIILTDGWDGQIYLQREEVQDLDAFLKELKENILKAMKR